MNQSRLYCKNTRRTTRRSDTSLVYLPSMTSKQKILDCLNRFSPE